MTKTIRHSLFIVGLLFAFTGQFSQAKEADVVRDLPTLGSYGSLSLVTGENKSLTPSAAPTNAASITAYTSGANATNFSGTLTVDPVTGVVSVTNAKPSGIYRVTVKATSLEGSSTTTFTLTVSDPESSDGGFRPNNDYVTGSAPNSVAIGDFNRDGKQDLVVANVNSNSISILLGNGAGGFGAKTDYPTNGAPVSVAVGDLTGDGAQDIVLVTSSNNSRVVYVGRGNGDFYPPIISATGDIPISVVIGDFNRDGKQDFAVANFFSNSVSIHLNIGTLSYSKTDFSTGENPLSVTIGDFNRDGWQDLATANSSSNTVSVLLGNGDGSFQAKADFGTDSNPQAVTVGDFNSDGYQDLAVANGGSKSTSILLGDGAGSFGAKTDFGTAVSPRFVSVGDFNGDGNQDLAVTNGSSNTVSILLGNGRGIFDGKTDFETGTEPRSVAVGDFNGDGKQDLAVVNFTSNNVSVLLGVDPSPTLGTYSSLTLRTGENKIHTPSAAPTNTSSITANTSGANATNFTGILTVDPATGAVTVTNAKQAGNYTVTVKAINNQGSTTTTFDLTITDPRESEGEFGPKTDVGDIIPIGFVAVGDFNGDGWQDLVASREFPNDYQTCSCSYELTILLNDGMGGFIPGSDIIFSEELGPVSVGDFNGDGKQDLAVSSSTLNRQETLATILMGNGDGSFTSGNKFVIGTRGPSLAVGDFNGDGKLDLVSLDQWTSSLGIWLGDGNGGFGEKTDFPTGEVSLDVSVGDFNGDLKQDLAVVNSGDNTVSVLLGDGQGGFGAKTDFSVGLYPRSVSIADFNKDGIQDLAVSNQFSNSVSILLGDGEGSFEPKTELGTGITPSSIAVGDFNGDSKPDLAVGVYVNNEINDELNNVSVFLGDGMGGFGTKTDYGTAYRPNHIAVIDLEGNGIQDLAVATRDGKVSILKGLESLKRLTLDDGSFVYDGSPKSLSLKGLYPTDATYTYTNNSRTDVGTQEVTLTISGLRYSTLVLTANLTITPATITDITFEGASFAYDGTEKSISITGELPAGTSVSYTNNGRTEVGTQEVTATISGPNYTTLVLKANLTVLECTTEAAFNASPQTGCSSSLTVFFTDQSSGTNTWLWEFGDGGTSSAQNPIHSYTSFGDFTVRLTASNSETGCSSILEKVISNQPVSADFASNVTFGCGPLTVDFEDQSQGATTWTWDFGDGTTSTEQNPSHTYQSSGRFTVTLSVNRGPRCTDTRSISNYIQVLGPEVEFTSDETEGCGPLTVSFTDQTRASAPFISFAWDFGDGQTSNQQNPTHTYANAGIFTVSLTVRDLDGCSRTLTKTGLIRVDALDFEFTDLDDVSCFDGSDGTVTVQVLDGTGPYTYLWSNEQTSATATDLIAGTYSVTVTDASGCQKTKEITISGPAQPTLVTDPANQIAATTAVLGGSLSSGLDCVQEVGVVYGLTSDPTVSDTKVAMSLAGNIFSNTISDLVINTTYFVRSYSINQNGYISYGENQSFTTLRKVLEVKVEEGQGKVFGETDPILRFTVSGFEGTDDKSLLSGELRREVGEDVGFYPIRLGTLDAGPNYTIDFTGADFEIGPATINGLTFEAQSFVFDGTEKSLSIQGTLPSGTSVVYTNNGRVDVGTQEVTATITGDNFTELVLKANLAINPANISDISFEAQSFVFDGTEKSLAITGTLPSGTAVAYTNNGRTDVGTQEVTATITGDNFTELVLKANLTINPANISNISFESQSFVFDGTEKSLTIQGTLPDGTSVAYQNNGRTDVGTQEVTATITGANFTELVLKANLTINPANISNISFEAQSFVFDGTEKSLAITGTLPAGTSVAYTNNSRTDVGTQEVTATITGANFTELVLKANLTINPASISNISFEAQSFVFDGTEKSLAIQGILPAGTSVAYTNNSRTNVGTQEVTATITGSNFTTLVLTADLTVTPATITGITFAEASFAFDGTAKSLAIGGELPSGTSVNYTNNSRTDVGTQEVTATISGDNFTELVLKADLTITPAELEGITFEDETFVFDGTEKSLAIQGTLPAGTSVTYTNNSRTDVGTQEVTATISGDNFTELVLKANLTINPANIADISFEAQSFVFDGSEKSLAITGTLPAGTAVAYTNNSRTDVGTQEVTATISGSNFTTLVLTADLTITPAPLEGITFEDETFVFDGAEKSLAIGGTLPAGTSVNYTNNSRTDVGTQEVTARISGSNFSTLVLTADLTITPAELEGITFEDEIFVFDGTEKSLTIQGTLPDGTSVAYQNNGRTDVGTQEVTARISGSNFSTLVLTADLTITPAELEGITFEDEIFVFDGTEKLLAIGGELPSGTSVNYTNNSRTNVGTQEVTATITGSNFTTLVLTADLTVTPATIMGITFADASFVFDGTEMALSIQGTLPTGTSVNYANNSRTNVGSQEVSATITGDNFTTLVLTADLTITPAVLTVTTDSGQIKLFGQADPVLTFTAAGYGAGDDVSIFAGALAREAGESVGFYAINQGSLDAGMNYRINFTGAVFEILTTDSDEDGVPDDVEEIDRTDPNDPNDFKDSDKDGVPDYVEEEQNTDPNNPSDFRDSDEDGVPDYVEDRDGSDPTDPTDFKDSDGDGVPDYVEETDGTDPNDPNDFKDSDEDGVPDHVEEVQDTDLNDPSDFRDSDEDSVPDYVEDRDGSDPTDPTDFKDSDGDGIPEYVEELDGTDPNDLNDFKDSDGDGVPNYVEDKEGTDSNDPSDIQDLDEDKVPDYVEDQDGTDPSDPTDFKDSDNDGIPDYRAERAIVSFVDQSKEVAWGTPAEALDLPTQVVAVTGTGALINLDVVWNTASYNPLLSSAYLIEGSNSILPAGLNNDFDLTPILSVTVLPKPAPQDVTLSNSQFEGSATEFFLEVGAFTVIDPSDDQHEISLVPGVEDNSFFEVIDGILFWSSAEQAAGRSEFTVRIVVQDRAGNELIKDFTIFRARTSFEEIEVPNTFTPNGDGVNDTWGVPALRYFRGARLQVFDNNGNRLFYTEDVDLKWDGTFNGKDMPIGAYFWVIEVQETGEVRRGVLNLLRQ